MTPPTQKKRFTPALTAALAVALFAGVAPATAQAATYTRSSTLIGYSSYNADGVSMTAPTVSVSGNQVTINAGIKTRRTTTFNHLLIYIPGGYDTGFNDGKQVRGSYAWTGTKNLASGTYTARISYQIGTHTWVNGPAVTFKVAAPTASAPTPTTTSTPTSTPTTSAPAPTTSTPAPTTSTPAPTTSTPTPSTSTSSPTTSTTPISTVLQTNTATGTTSMNSSTLTPAIMQSMESNLTQGTVGGLWISIGRSPSIAEAQAAATKHNAFVLNAWDTAQMRAIKQANPKAMVLVYKCISSTRNYSGAVVNGQDAAYLPTGVGYVAASAHPNWFATTTSGSRIEWSGYPQHWQMAVWDPSYQQAWADSVAAEVTREGWDGVMADNVFYNLSHYSSATLAGTTSTAETDAKLRTGMDQIIAKIGVTLNADGKVFVPNLSDGRLDLTRWQQTGKYGGVLEENFTHWGASATVGHIYDWGSTGWVDQTAELAAPLTLAITRIAPGDYRTMRYSYGSALVRAQGRVAWTMDTDGTYTAPERFEWQDINFGKPLGAGTRASNGVWVRAFENKLVVVNPTMSTQTVSVPVGYAQSTVTVGSLDSVIVNR